MCLLSINALSEQTVTKATTTGLWVKVTVERGEGYNPYTRTVAVTLSPATVTVTGSSAANKDYDGTNTAEITLGTVGGVVGGDDVEVAAAGTFENTEPGENKAVTITYTLSGEDASNYRIDNGTATATINYLTITGITFTGGEITYDGTAHGCTLSGANTTTDTILYSMDGTTYNLSACPTYSDAGTYTTYVKISRAHYNDWTGSATLEITAKEITLDSVNVDPVAYGANTSASVTSYSLSSGGDSITGSEKNTIGRSLTWSASFDNTNTLGSHDVEVTATLSSSNYVFSNGTNTVTTTISGNVYTGYALSSNGKASTGDGKTAEGRGAEETTELYIDFDANPGDVDQSNIAITTGGSYVAKTGAGTLTPVLEGTKYRITVPVAKTNTAGTGIDDVKVTISGVTVIDPAQSNATGTYLPLCYWGCYSGNDPSIPNVKAYGWGHVLTEAPSTEMINNTQRRYYDVPYDREEPNITTGRPYVLVLKQIGTVSEILNYATPSNPEDETTAYNRVDDNNTNGYSGVIAKLAEYSDGTLYKAIVS